MAGWSYCTLNWFGDQYKYWVFFDEIDDHHREIEEWKEKYTQDLLCEMGSDGWELISIQTMPTPWSRLQEIEVKMKFMDVMTFATFRQRLEIAD